MMDKIIPVIGTRDIQIRLHFSPALQRHPYGTAGSASGTTAITYDQEKQPTESLALGHADDERAAFHAGFFERVYRERP